MPNIRKTVVEEPPESDYADVLNEIEERAGQRVRLFVSTDQREASNFAQGLRNTIRRRHGKGSDDGRPEVNFRTIPASRLSEDDRAELEVASDDAEETSVYAVYGFAPETSEQ